MKKSPHPPVKHLPMPKAPISPAPTSIAAFVGPTATGPLNQPQLITSFAAFETTFGGLNTASELSYAVQHFFTNGGTQAWIVNTLTATAADLIGTEQAATGLYAFTPESPFNLLCLPDAADGNDPASVYVAALNLCHQRQAFLLIDPPGAVNDVAAATTWMASVPNDPSAAAFFPRLTLADPLNAGAPRTSAPSGLVAGLFARSDAQHGVWKSPAGTAGTLTGVLGLACTLNDAQNGQLNALGLNCFRTVPQHGIVLWGARTLAGADTNPGDFKYIAVRRLSLFIETSIRSGLQWVVFEPNAEPLRSQIRLSVGTFMHALFQQGAFQGTTPAQAYFVKCAGQTSMEDTMVNIVVGFAPLRPAEFVVLSLNLLTDEPRP